MYPSHLAPRLKEKYAYGSIPPVGLWPVLGWNLLSRSEWYKQKDNFYGFFCVVLNVASHSKWRTAYENRLLRCVCGCKRMEAIGYWRKTFNEGLRELYFFPETISLIKSTRMRWAWHHNNRGRKCIEILMAKRGRKRPLVRSMHRQEDNIAVYLNK